jgi:glycosyltransferase involved in cell wall biosynthesis
MKPPILISHPANQGTIYFRPWAAKRERFPTRFATGLYYQPERWPYSWLRRIPKVERFLARRKIEGLDSEDVVSFGGPWIEFLCRPLRPFGYLGGALWYDVIHDALVARAIRRGDFGSEKRIFHGFQNSCLRSMAEAKKRGWPTLLEITLPPCMTKIMHEERLRLGLKSTGGDVPKRQLQEIEVADYTVHQSQFSLRCLESLGAKRERMIHLPMGGDMRRFSPRATRNEGDPFVVLILGQLQLRKGIHHLLEVWSEWRPANAKLLLVGACTDPDIRPFLERYKDCFERRGFAPAEELPDIYRSADVFVVPSLAEGGVNVIYEAMASGLPCVVSERSGSAVVDGINGFVFPTGDRVALRRALEALYADRELTRRMSLAALERARIFRWEDFSRRLGTMYMKVLSANGAGFGDVLDMTND